MSGERTEKPTGKRLSEARSRGQVARSPEVNSTLVLLGSFATLAIAAPAMWSTLKSTFHDTIVRTANPEISTTTVPGLMDGWMQTVASLLLPLFAVAAVAGVTANVIQNKPGLILSGIKPDFKKLSPVPGLKRMVGPEALIELAKTLFKVVVVGAVGFLVIWPELPTLMHMNEMSTGEMASYTGGLISRLVFAIILILVPLAVADLMLSRKRHTKSLMMSKQEVKEEARQQDIAPEIKAAIKRRARDMARTAHARRRPHRRRDRHQPDALRGRAPLRQGLLGSARRREGRRPARAAHPRDRGGARHLRSSRTRRWPAPCTARSTSGRRSRPTTSAPSPRSSPSSTAPRAAR